MTRTVLAEDQLIFSEALTALLADAEEIKIVKCVENGQVLLDYLKTNKVDLVLMDLKMPVLNGIEATNILKKNYPSIKVLVLSFYVNVTDVVRAMDAGADGYLSKNTSKPEILEAIECLKKNKPYYSPDVIQSLAKTNSLNGGSGIIKLSDREKEVLELISRGFSSKQIGERLNLAESTVRTHRNSLLEKFSTLNSASLTRMAIEHGYI